MKMTLDDLVTSVATELMGVTISNLEAASGTCCTGWSTTSRST